MASYILCNGELLDYDQFTLRYGKPTLKAFESSEVGELINTIQDEKEKIMYSDTDSDLINFKPI